MAISQALSGLDGLWWLLILTGPLLIFQRSLHRELQTIFYILTRKPGLAIGLFSILFFPGVLLHEGSHFGMAKLLGVRTGRVSLIPRPINGGKKLQLGFVETVSSGALRDTLIGAAPLITGGILVAYIGLIRLDLGPLWTTILQGSSANFDQILTGLPGQADFWLWFYLAFVISSTMLPSASDRQAWLPVGLIGVGLFVFALIAGAGGWMAVHIEPFFNQAMRGVASVFGISLVIHIVCWCPVILIRLLLTRMTGVKAA